MGPNFVFKNVLIKKYLVSHGDPPGVPRVPIFGPNRGMFSKLNWPGPLGSGGHSHTIFSNGRFQGAQRSFGGDVIGLKHVPNRCQQQLTMCFA